MRKKEMNRCIELQSKQIMFSLAVNKWGLSFFSYNFRPKLNQGTASNYASLSSTEVISNDSLLWILNQFCTDFYNKQDFCRLISYMRHETKTYPVVYH